MGTPGQRFPRVDRLLRRGDFQRIGGSDRRAVGPGFVVMVAGSSRRDGERQPRIGVTVSRRVGNAVVRNRIKRHVREWFRRARATVPACLDVLVIARRAARDLEGRQVGEVLQELVDRAARTATT